MAEDVLLDSVVRVTWDPDGAQLVLVEIDDPMWEPVKIDGKQAVDTAPGLNRAGVQNFPRGNEAHKLTFTLCRIEDEIQDAFQERIAQALAAPRYMADVLLSFASGTNYRIKNAAVESWPNDQRGRLTKETLVILGGEIVEDSGTTAPDSEAEVALYADSGMQAETLEALATWLNQGAGSMDAVQATGANQPVAIARSVLTSTYYGGLYLPGIAGNYGSVPDNAILDLSGDLCLAWQGKLDSYTPAAKTCLISKWTAAGDQRSFALFVNTDGTIELQLSTDGTAAGILTYTSTVPSGLAPRTLTTIAGVRVGSTIRFWLASTSFPPAGGLFSTEAIQLGAAITGVSTAVFNSTASLNIGATDDGTLNLMKGYSMQVITRKTHNNTAASASTDFWLQFFNSASGSTTVADFYAAGNMTVNRTGVLPAKIVSGFRAQFDGTNDSMTLATPLQANGVSGVSLAWRGTLNRVTGDNDLIFCGTADGLNPRALLRVDDGDLKVMVRRLDAEATATITYAAGLTQYAHKTLAASINYATGTAALYVDGVLVASGALTSAGTTSATNSGITRIMAGASAANPAAGDVGRLVIQQTALDIFEMAALHQALLLNEG